MIRFYFHPTPNPAKIALLLEETGLPYEVIPVDTSKGEQHTSAYRAINPNRTSGDPSEQLRERHDASDFRTKTQDRLVGQQA
jgi:hypothetical protein